DTAVTIPQLAAQYLVHVKVNRKKKTFSSYRTDLRHFVMQFGGRRAAAATWPAEDLPQRLVGGEEPLDCRKLTLTHGNEFKNYLTDDCCYSPVTVNHYLRIPKMCLEWATLEGVQLLKTNPWKHLEYLPEDFRHRIITDAEFAQLLQANADPKN